VQRPQKTVFPLALAAFATGAALPAPGGAETSGASCIAPEVVGVNLSMARRALGDSGCQVTVRQLPAHGTFVTPAQPDGRQLVARQSPKAGRSSQDVTVWVKPLCAQSALPGPAQRGPRVTKGPTELIAGLYLEGGPLRTGPHCRRGTTEAGTVTVSTPAGKVLLRRQVRAGHFGIFPLAPGSYVVGGTFSGGAPGARPQVPQTPVTIAARRTTRLNVVVDVP
jgi:hypothetical protein